jgi:signal transduction histidine kinase/CheY-like chemotaxis protein
MASILIVDDHPENRDFMRTLLAYYRHEVIEAQDGAEALPLAQKVCPDLIISDILMPVMDGYELARNLRANPALAKIPIVFWTAHYLERETRALAEQFGIAEIIRKPSEPGEILKVVEAALGPPARPLPADVRPTPRSAHELSQIPGDIGWTKLRLEALVGAIHRLSSERDPQRVLDLACREAREMIGPASAIVAMVDSASGDLRECRIRGAETRVDSAFCQTLIWFLRRDGADIVRMNRLDLADSPELTLGESPLHSLLAIQIGSPDKPYGWMCLVNKIGAAGFSHEDEQVALAFAIQVALVYESVQLQSQVVQLNTQLTRQVAMLSQSNADLEQFGYAVSHDLKEPLSSVYGFAGLLSKHYADATDPSTREFVGFIRDGIDRARGMIDGLLSLYRAGRNGDPPAAAADSNEIVEMVGRNCSESIAECGATVTHDPLPMIAIAGSALLQIFQNLISNSLKYRRADIPPRIHVSARILDDLVEFAVQDNGIGIRMEHRERVFQLFQRLNGDRYPGIGLGLSLCARLVQGSGGRIWVDTAPEGGSIFYFTLPAAGSGGAADALKLVSRAASS